MTDGDVNELRDLLERDGGLDFYRAQEVALLLEDFIDKLVYEAEGANEN